MTDRLRRGLRVRIGLVLLVSAVGCAPMPPERAARRELLWTAAQACRNQYPFIMRLDYDRFDRLFWLYREGTSQSDREAFSACYQQTIQQLTKAAAVPAGEVGSAAPVSAPRPFLAEIQVVPVLRPGSEWTYRWESPRGSGTFVWKVDREEVVNGIEAYVVRSGSREIYWRKLDGASFMEKVSGVVVVTHTPPRQNFRWPLRVGTSWELLYVTERPVDRETGTRLWQWRVEGVESIRVPAGTFDTFKIVARDRWADRIAWEYWYAPAVRNLVRSRDHHTYGVETRELLSYTLAP